MITIAHFDGIGSIAINENGDFKITVEGNDELLQLLSSEILRGIPYLKKFKQEGIPGEIRAYKKIKDDDDIVSFVEYVAKKYPNYLLKIFENNRYTILKWNGEYGAEARFIVRDNLTDKQCLFTPGECEDLVWFHCDLANDETVSVWSYFGNESFDDLESIIM